MKFFGKQVSILIFLSVFLSSCAGMFEYRPYARNVKKKPRKSGVIALKLEHRDEDRALADSMMAKNCGSKTPEVIDEGEVAIGTVTKSNKKSRKGDGGTVGSLFGIPVTSGSADTESQSSTTMQKKEWQISYKCR